MKKATADLFQQHLAAKKFTFQPSNLGLELRHDFTDAEILEIVEAEYSKTLTQSVDQLFELIVKDLINTGLEYAKASELASGKLSDL
jgi:hypothetical protein